MKVDVRTTCLNSLSHVFCKSSNVPATLPYHGACGTHSGQVSCIHWLYATPFLSCRHTFYSDVSDVLSTLYLIAFVLRACSCAARIKSSVSFYKNPFLSHLQVSSPITSAVCLTNSPCKGLFFHFPPSPSVQLVPSTLHFLLHSHIETWSSSLHTPQD